MQPNDLLKANSSNLRWIGGFGTTNEVGHFIEMVHYEREMESCCRMVLKSPSMKSILMSYHEACGIGNGVYSPMFCQLTSLALPYDFGNISLEIGPMESILNRGNGLVPAKVASGSPIPKREYLVRKYGECKVCFH